MKPKAWTFMLCVAMGIIQAKNGATLKWIILIQSVISTCFLLRLVDTIPASAGGGPSAGVFPKDDTKRPLRNLRNGIDEEVQASIQTQHQGSHVPTIRVLVGIFSADIAPDRRYRNKFRELFVLDPRVCSLRTFQTRVEENNDSESCQLIYTFVVGANETGPTQLVDDLSLPFLVNGPVTAVTSDFNDEDMTHLNIKENMNEGKSQTWFAYGAKLTRQYSIDYIAKTDTDSLLYLDKYFAFVQEQLYPAPYNRNILAGSVADKMWWTDFTPLAPSEDYFRNKFDGNLHLYTEGQWYLMSPDLAETVALEAPKAGSYLENHEDHDVASMAFHSSRPVHLIIIAREEKHWRHPVKLSLGVRRFHGIWQEEIDRMRNVVKQERIVSLTVS